MDALLAKAAKALSEALNGREREERIFLFSLRVLWSAVLSTASIILAALAAGVLREALWALMAGGTLRMVSGGAHASTPVRCAVVGAVSYTGLAILARLMAGSAFGSVPGAILAPMVFIWAGIAWIIVKYAPADTPGKPIVGDRRRYRLKTFSLAVFIVWCLFGFLSALPFPIESSGILIAVTLGLAWQASTLTPAGYRLGRILDSTLVS